MANRQGSLNLGFTISLPAPNLEYVALVSIWTSMPNSQVRGYTQVRRFSRLAKEFQVPRLPNFPVPRFKKGPRFPGSLSPVSTPVTNKSPVKNIGNPRIRHPIIRNPFIRTVTLYGTPQDQVQTARPHMSPGFGGLK